MVSVEIQSYKVKTKKESQGRRHSRNGFEVDTVSTFLVSNFEVAL